MSLEQTGAEPLVVVVVVVVVIVAVIVGHLLSGPGGSPHSFSAASAPFLPAAPPPPDRNVWAELPGELGEWGGKSLGGDGRARGRAPETTGELDVSTQVSRERLISG